MLMQPAHLLLTARPSAWTTPMFNNSDYKCARTVDDAGWYAFGFRVAALQGIPAGLACLSHEQAYRTAPYILHVCLTRKHTAPHLAVSRRQHHCRSLTPLLPTLAGVCKASDVDRE